MSNILKKFIRDENGLIEGVNYIFAEDGAIDWRAMVPEKFLYANKEKTTETDVSKLSDKELIINLAGIRFLAKLRGYDGYRYSPHTASEHYAAVTCSIYWKPNYETEDRAIVSEGVAGASLDNTTNIGRAYLIETAGNRAFCRAVREFLNISIVSQEELGAKQETSSSTAEVAVDSPHARLQKILTEKGLDFQWLKTKLTESGEIAPDVASIDEIPTDKLLNIISRVQKYKPKKD